MDNLVSNETGVVQLKLPFNSVEDEDSKSQLLKTIEQLHRDINNLKKEIDYLEEENRNLQLIINDRDHTIEEMTRYNNRRY